MSKISRSSGMFGGALRLAAARLQPLVLTLGVGASACTASDDPVIGETSSAITVGGGVTSGCSTAVVLGLAKQIAKEVDCMSSANTLVPFAATSTIKFSSSAVLPYLNSSAKTDLASAAASGALQVNSGYRTVPQQYLLYRWAQAGRCGIAVAARPGTSNHESGRAVDLANWSARRSAMAAHGWAHDVPGDSVHFDHLSSPNLAGRDVTAFQRLWNRNHPSDKISVDGAYGPQTADRLSRSPAAGFAIGASCPAASVVAAAEVVSVEGPDRVVAGVPTHYVVTLTNPGDADWPADARIVVADGTPSALYDAATWTSPTEVGTLGAPIAVGSAGTIAFDVVAPAATEDTPIATTFAVMQDGRQLASVDFAVTIAVHSDPGASSEDGVDPDEVDDGLGDANGAVAPSTGGCSAGGGAGGWLGLLVPLAVIRGRRRR